MELLRSLLFVPATSEAMLEKAHLRGADGIALDLEDAITPDRKEEARDAIERWIPKLQERQQYVLVRTNSAVSGLLEADLLAAVKAGADGILFPKAEPDFVAYAHDIITTAEDLARTGKRTRILPLIETPRGIELAFEVAKSSTRVSGLVLGAGEYGDLAAALQLQSTLAEAEILYCRSRTVLATRAAGLDLVLDGIWSRVRDLDGLDRSTRLSRQLGFNGRAIIHPSHVPVVNKLFAPDPDEVAQAIDVVEAYEASVLQGRGAGMTSSGMMVDLAMAKRAKSLLKIERLLSESGRED